MRIFVAAILLSMMPLTAAHAEDADELTYCEAHWHAVGQCWHRPWRRPQLVLGLQGGVAGLVEGGPFGFGHGTGSATDLGPQWGLSAGVDFLSWLGVEARYVGWYNSGAANVSQGGSVAFLTTGGEAILRFTLPTPYVRPYIFGGVGYYDSRLLGSDTARTISTLTNNDSVGIPMGVGAEVPLTWYVSIGAEATFRFLLSESFSNAPARDIDGADFTTFSAVLKAHL